MLVTTIVMLLVMKATLIEEGAVEGEEPVENWQQSLSGTCSGR